MLSSLIEIAFQRYGSAGLETLCEVLMIAKAYGDFILNYTPNYIQRRPITYPSNLPWPSNDQIVDSLAEMSKQNWPYVFTLHDFVLNRSVILYYENV